MATVIIIVLLLIIAAALVPALAALIEKHEGEKILTGEFAE